MVGSGHKVSKSGKDAATEVEVRQVTGPTNAGSKPFSEPKASADRNVLGLLEKNSPEIGSDDYFVYMFQIIVMKLSIISGASIYMYLHVLFKLLL